MLERKRKVISILLVLAFIVLASAIVVNYTKYGAAVFFGFYPNHCDTGSFAGVHTGMSRSAVLQRISSTGRVFTTDWYIEDPEIYPPELPWRRALWAPPLLPARLMEADEWVMHKAGHTGDYMMIVSFNERDIVTCADIRIEIASF